MHLLSWPKQIVHNHLVHFNIAFVCKPVSTTTTVTGPGTTYDVPSGDDCMAVLLHRFCLVSLFVFIVCTYVFVYQCLLCSCPSGC